MAIQLVVVIDDAYHDKMNDIAKTLEENEFKVVHQLDELLVITGSGDSNKIDFYKSIEGVLSVEVDVGVTLFKPPA